MDTPSRSRARSAPSPERPAPRAQIRRLPTASSPLRRCAAVPAPPPPFCGALGESRPPSRPVSPGPAPRHPAPRVPWRSSAARTAAHQPAAARIYDAGPFFSDRSNAAGSKAMTHAPALPEVEQLRRFDSCPCPPRGGAAPPAPSSRRPSKQSFVDSEAIK